ncbi:MAG: hypothetical protein HQK83_06380 [Fibrobacteria bacterium]|nr:hypothetical protein [Fibrobacteria bacterium]
MELKQLSRHIQTLALLPVNNNIVVSCYLTLEKGIIKDRAAFTLLLSSIKAGIENDDGQKEFDKAIEKICDFLSNELNPDAGGIALFSRTGKEPFFLALQFKVPLPNWMSVDNTPNIFHLIELKDNYHKFIVLYATKNSARIMEVNLGEVTENLWMEKPELRERVGREWTKEKYQNHQADRGKKFVKEKIKVLENLMNKGGFTHLILAGNAAITTHIQKLLPKHMLDKLVDIVHISGVPSISNIVKSTLLSFLEIEEKESQDMAELLSKELKTGGLAVAGTSSTLMALKLGNVDVVVMSQRLTDNRHHLCPVCYFISTKGSRDSNCPNCRATKMNSTNLKEEIIRLAEQQGCHVEVVSNSKLIDEMGGVGCLLRYKLNDAYS